MQHGKSLEIFAQKLTRFYRYADQEAQATVSGGPLLATATACDALRLTGGSLS
jgi:hypothetical protein